MKNKDEHNLYVTYDEVCEGGDLINPNDRWSEREPEYKNITLKDVYLQKDNEKLPWYTKTIYDVKFEPRVGDIVYLVVVTYQNGDTFGYSCGNVHIEGAYKEIEEANSITNSIKNKTYRKYAPWDGYFERLEDAKVHAFKIADFDEKDPNCTYHF